ncbi:MAG: methyltransferase domain-containing protein [Cyclobacteriaceae bacterium]|nr:methyltransferase domain-containing protein [Cyclobacteriaceae bacterium]
MTPENFYVHGHSPEEQRRLSLLNDLLNPDYLLQVGPWTVPGIIDFGCGLGHIARQIKAQALPGTRVLGIDRDEQQLARARALTAPGEVEFLQHDVLKAPLDPAWQGAFDIAHARFLLEHVPDPARVVAKMAASVRPGGRVILADDDHSSLSLYPVPPHFQQLWSAYEQTYEVHGNDPFIGRKLVSLLHGAGLQPARNGFVFFGSCTGHPHFQDFVANLHEVLDSAKHLLVNYDLLDARTCDQALDEFRSWSRRGDAAIWYPLFYAIGVK